MIELAGFLLGGILFWLGFLQLNEKINQMDAQAFLSVHKYLRENISPTFFHRLWFLGRTPCALFCLGGLTVLDWRRGVITGGIFTLAAGLEVGVKKLVGRPRPFERFSLGEVEMLQPQPPTDPSFPSGDSFRVWFLALILPAFWGVPWFVYPPLVCLAAVVTLGRVAMGVHYPLDTVSGAGLGVMSAGLTVFLWQILG